MVYYICSHRPATDRGTDGIFTHGCTHRRNGICGELGRAEDGGRKEERR